MFINLSNYEKELLQDIIKEEITEYLDSGYSKEDNYVITLNNILNKFKGSN